MNVIYEIGAVSLDAVGMVASWRRPRSSVENNGRFVPSIVVMQSSTCDEGVYQPAADVMVGGRDALLALRSAIDEALREVD